VVARYGSCLGKTLYDLRLSESRPQYSDNILEESLAVDENPENPAKSEFFHVRLVVRVL
jgi:hypothetical protein